MNNKQGLKASYSLIVMLILTASIMLLVDYKFMDTWLAFFFILSVPVQVAMGELLNADKNNFLTSIPQPLKGMLVTLICALSAGVYTFITFNTIGGSIDRPGPPLLSYSIVVVVMTFWYAIVWRCWPVSEVTNSAYWRCISILTLPFIFAYIIYIEFFNFSFLQSSPLYYPSIDPGGLFNSWYVIAFLVTTVAILFSLMLFEFKLFVIYNSRPFLWGSANSLFILLVSSVIYFSALWLIDMDPVVYLVNGPISYIFGIFIPLNLYKGTLFQNIIQPKRGVYLILLSLLSGAILNILYTRFFIYFGPEVLEGNQGYILELWMANAMLAFSFPILVALTEHFDFWPVKNNGKKYK